MFATDKPLSNGLGFISGKPSLTPTMLKYFMDSAEP